MKGRVLEALEGGEGCAGGCSVGLGGWRVKFGEGGGSGRLGLD